MGRLVKIKTVDVNVKEWFDKVNGNSYFAGSVTINYCLKTEKTFNIPFQYGSGDHYKNMAFKALKKAGYFTETKDLNYWREYEKLGIIARHNKQENCLKRELK